MLNLKWYHLVAIALGLGAIVAIVYLVIRDEDIRAKLKRNNHKMIEEETDLVD